MKKQHLLVLAAALVVLAGLRFLLDRGPRTAGSLEDAGLVRVLGEGFEPESVGWMRLTGPGEGDSWEVRREDEGWVVASAWDAPAEAERIEEILTDLRGLRGELRGEGEGLRAEFGLDEDSAARLELGETPGEESAALWIGKAGDGPGTHFVLRDGDDRILHLARGLAADLGLVGENRQPKAQHAVDLAVTDWTASELTAVTVDRPDANWQLVRDPMAAAGDEDDAPAEAGWRLAEPELGMPLREGAVEGLAGRLARVRATRVLDPSVEACGDEALTARIALDSGGESRSLRLGSKPIEGDLVALRVDEAAACFGLSRWTAESLLPRAARLVELPKPLGEEAPASEDFTRLDLEIDGTSLRLEREGEDWKLTRPERAPADSARVERLLSALRFLSWDDVVAQGVVRPELAEEHAVLTARTKDGAWTLRLLGERPGGYGGARYAAMEGGEPLPDWLLGVLGGTAVDSLTPSLDELRAEPETDEAG